MKQRLKKLTENFIPKSNSSNITVIDQFEEVSDLSAIRIIQSKQKNRLKKIRISEKAFPQFLLITKEISVTDLEYIVAYRFFVASILNKVCDNQLKKIVNEILHDRSSGAFILEVENFYPDVDKDFEKMLKLSTAISYLFGKANLDSMSGLYYARFVVKNSDASDSFLRKFSDRLTLHNDGAFVNELTDYVLMMKISEENTEGGRSLLLHLDDWEDLNEFYHHPLSGVSFKFSSPPSKHVNYNVYHPIFHHDKDGLPCMSYIDQFIKPSTPEEGLYTYALSQSLESSQSVIGFDLVVGSMVICNNHFWLHGRDKFESNTKLYRELMRQRGVFFDNLFHQPYPDKIERF